ncbi:hypothetical protein HR10_00575 [Porphyromonas gulae]|nr:hypothetical protein HR10_00575 [Porphyromonas gulae]
MKKVVCRVGKGLFGGKSASRHRKTPPQLAGSLFGTTMSSRKLRQAFLVQRCRPASCGKLFRCEFVIPQLAGANFVSEMQFVRWGICISMAEMQIPHRTMAFPRPKPSLLSLLLHLWPDDTKTNPKRPFGWPFGVRVYARFLLSQEDSLSPFLLAEPYL